MPQLNRLYFKFRNYFSGNFPKAYSFCDKRKSALKFFIAGSLAGATDLIFLYIFHGVFFWRLVVSTSLAFVLSFVVSFALQKFWTFRNFSQSKAAHQFALYILNAFIGLNLNAFLMHLFVSRYRVWYLLAQVIVSLMIGVYNFIIYRSIVFKIGKDEINHEQKTSGSSAGNLA
jgi:putative flippase GtrA